MSVELVELHDFDFDTPIPVSVGRVYTIVVPVPEMTIGYLRFASGDPYPGGLPHRGRRLRALVQ